MNKERAIGLIALSLGLAIMTFNNCSEVGFTPAPEEVVNPATSTSAPATSDLSDQESQDIINQLPPDEVDTPRPITDLETDPSLYDRYKCPDSDGVVICHFPENIDSQATQCIGRAAAQTHFDHTRQYIKDGMSKEISDYLGPCRVAL